MDPRAILASLVAGSGPERYGQGLGFVEGLSPVGRVVRATWFDGAQ